MRMRPLSPDTVDVPRSAALIAHAERRVELDADLLGQYRAAVADILRLPPDDRFVLEYLAGVGVVASRLHAQDMEVLERLLRLTGINRFKRIILGAYLTSRWWMRCEESIQSYPETFGLSSLERTRGERVSPGVLARSSTGEHEKFSEHFLIDHVTLFTQAVERGEADAFTRRVYNEQDALAGETPYGNASGQLNAGVHTGNYYPWKFLEVAPAVYEDHVGRELRKEDQADLEEVGDSVVPLNRALSRRGIFTFLSVVKALANDTSPTGGRVKVATFPPRAENLCIREADGKRSMEIRPEIAAKLAVQSDPRLKCSATLARGIDDKDVVVAFQRQLILPLWKRFILPRIGVDAR